MALISQWKLDETSGLVASDSVGALSGDLTNMVGDEWITSGVIDGALQFDGVDDTVIIPAPAGTITDNFTIACHFKLKSIPAADNTMIWRFHDSALGQGKQFTLMGQGASGLVFIVSANGTSNSVVLNSSGILNTEQWYHAAGVYDGSEVIIYVDGVRNNGTNYAAGVFDSDNDIRFGTQWNEGGAFDGYLDDIRLYNTALTASELEEIMTPSTSAAVIRRRRTNVFQQYRQNT